MKRSILSLTIILSAIFANFAISAALPEPQNMTAQPALVIFTIPNFEQARSKFENLPMYKLWHDPAMKPFVSKFRQTIMPQLKLSEHSLLVNLADPNKMPKGRLNFLIMDKTNTVADNKVAFVVAADFGKNADSFKTSFDDYLTRTNLPGTKKTSATYNGINISKLIIPRPQANQYTDSNSQDPNMPAQLDPKDPNRSPMYISHFFVDSIFVAAIDTKEQTVKQLIDRIKTPPKVESDTPDKYTAAMTPLLKPRDAELFIDIERILQLSAQNDPTGKTAQNIQTAGLQAVKNFVASVNLTPEQNKASQITALLKIDGPRQGALNIFNLKTASINPPEFLDPQTGTVVVLNWDINQAWSSLATILAGINPMAGAMINMPLTPPGPAGEPGISISADVFSNLGSQITVTRSIVPGKDNQPFSQKFLFAIEAKNAQKLKNSLATLHNFFMAQGRDDMTTQYKGYTVHKIEQPPSTSPQNPMKMQFDMPDTFFAVTDSHLVFADMQTLHTALDNTRLKGGKPFSSIDWVKKAMDNLPPAAGLAAFTNQQNPARVMWNYLRTSPDPIANMNINNTNPLALMLAEWNASEMPDFKLLPEYEKVRQYFGIDTFFILNRADGIYFRSEKLTDINK